MHAGWWGHVSWHQTWLMEMFNDPLTVTVSWPQVLCTSWWNTPLRGTWGSTCGHGGHLAWTTPSTHVRSLMSSSPSKTWFPAPTRLPEGWSTSLRRRSVWVLSADVCAFSKEFSCFSFSLTIILKEIEILNHNGDFRLYCYTRPTKFMLTGYN